MTDEKKKIENLKRILHRDNLDRSSYLKLEDLVAVRALNGYSNLKNKKMYPSPFRPTIHFSLNHLVESHIYGNWNDASEVYIIPFKDLLEKNNKNFIGGSTVDIYFAGPIVLPEKYTIVKREANENKEDFKNKVETEIENQNYLVVPGGTWDWGGSFASCELKKLFRTLGNYIVEPHSNSCFYETDFNTGLIVKYLLENQLKENEIKKELTKRFREKFGNDISNKLKKALLENPDVTATYHDDDYEEKTVTINGTVYRLLWKDIFKKTLKNFEKREEDEKFYKGLFSRLEPYLDDWIYNHPSNQSNN